MLATLMRTMGTGGIWRVGSSWGRGRMIYNNEGAWMWIVVMMMTITCKFIVTLSDLKTIWETYGVDMGIIVLTTDLQALRETD